MSKVKFPQQEIIWTPELAYVVGLLATDGCLSNDGRHITMRSSDRGLLEVFRKCLSLNVKIGKTTNNGYATKPSFRVQFGNVHLYRWLIDIGLSPAKTYTIGRIKIPDFYFRDFLRGHLDGDGSVYTYQDRYNFYRHRNYLNHRLYTQFISVSQNHIKWLHKRIQKLVGIKGSPLHYASSPERKSVMWKIKFAKKESIRLLAWIYYEPALPCLQRKRILSKKILKLVTNQKRRKYSRI